MTEAPQDATAGRRSNPWAVLGVLLLLYVVNFADRYLITGLIGPIKQEFGLGDGLIGLVMGPAFVVLYVIMGVPLARMADRGSRIRIIALGCLAWSVATIGTGLAIGPASLVLARICVGVGEAAFVAPAYSLLTDYFRPERRGVAFAVMGFATYAGQILGQGGGPMLAQVEGWRFAFWTMGACGLALGAIALLAIHEPTREKQGETAHLPFRGLLSLFAGSRAAVLITGSMSFGMLSGVAFGYWAPELFTRSLGLDPVTVKAAFAVNFGLSGLAGTVLFGIISDRMSRRGMIWPARLTAIAMGSTTAVILLAIWARDFTVVSLLAIPAGLLGGGWSVGLHASVQYLFPASVRASGTSLYLGISTLVAQFAGPFAAGLLSDAMGGGGEALRLALTIVLPFGFLGAIMAWMAAGHVAADQQALARTTG